jgi:hypothetical protein
VDAKKKKKKIGGFFFIGSVFFASSCLLDVFLLFIGLLSTASSTKVWFKGKSSNYCFEKNLVDIF